MKLRTQTSATLKAKLSSTLKSWLPILQSGMEELEETLGEFAKENPYLGIQSNISTDFTSQKRQQKDYQRGERSKGTGVEVIERYALCEESLEEVLLSQIIPPLFPTQKSQKIAQAVIENLSEEGYFVGEIETLIKGLECTKEEFERIRKRFAYLDPPGIGALDLMESFYFQLEHMDVENEVWELCTKILKDLEQHAKYKKESCYIKAMRVIQSFKNPPALDYYEKDPEVIPDILVQWEGNNIQVQINDKFYPTIVVEAPPKSAVKEDFMKIKIKEARDLVDALEMRKATLYKIGLMIVEYQYEFFMGGEIKPMKLKDLADEFGHASSTISRAISNKYLECSRGIFPLKNFFATALDEDTSNAAIKEFVADIVKNENKQKPLSDTKILDLIEEKFNIRIVRRTITKYRAQLNIASSSERKKMYRLLV